VFLKLDGSLYSLMSLGIHAVKDIKAKRNKALEIIKLVQEYRPHIEIDFFIDSKSLKKIRPKLDTMEFEVVEEVPIDDEAIIEQQII
jgi:hypothetical protein